MSSRGYATLPTFLFGEWNDDLPSGRRHGEAPHDSFPKRAEARRRERSIPPSGR